MPYLFAFCFCNVLVAACGMPVVLNYVNKTQAVQITTLIPMLRRLLAEIYIQAVVNFASVAVYYPVSAILLSDCNQAGLTCVYVYEESFLLSQKNRTDL